LNRLLCLSLLVFVVGVSHAQLNQTNRYEMLMHEDDLNYEVLTCGEEGLVVWRTLQTKNYSDSLILELTLLDTTLNQVWTKRYPADKNLEYIAQKYHEGGVYFLFRNYTNKVRNLKLIELNLTDGSINQHTIKNIIPFSYFNMEVTDRSVVIGGYFNYRPLVLLFDFIEKIPRVLPGLFNDKSELAQMKVNDNNTIDIVLTGRNVEKDNTLFIYTFDDQARLLKMIELNATKRKSLLFGRSKYLSGLSQIVAGVYGRRNSDYSRGVFMANINEYGEQNIKYYNYAEFENFFSYMRAKREARIKRRIERKKIKNKKIKFNYRLLVHEIIEHDNQYILLGEAFYPKYKTVPNTPGMFNPVWSVNRGLFSYNRIFEGYQYTHAVVIGFNKKGDVLWDNSFEIKDVLSKRLQQFVHVSVDEDYINLLYVYDNAIRSKVVSGDDVIEGKSFTDIELKYENDTVDENDTEVEGFSKWYDDVFVTYGFQTVKNMRKQGVALNRDVFFVNKVITK